MVFSDFQGFARVNNIINHERFFAFHNRGYALRQNWLVFGFSNTHIELDSYAGKVGDFEEVGQNPSGNPSTLRDAYDDVGFKVALADFFSLADEHVVYLVPSWHFNLRF